MSSPATSVRSLLHSIVLSKGRMEALTDGIFAIAMTLLVLELKVPELPKSASSGELLHSLGQQMPAYVSFLVSFLYCAVLWLMHHLAMHFIRHLQVGLVWLNLLFLMSISVLPFSCALLGHFIRNTAAQEIYFLNMFIAAVLLCAHWLLAKVKKLISEDDPRAVKVMGQRLLVFPLALGAAMAATPFEALGGFNAMVVVLVAMRLWQRWSFRKETRTLSSPPLSS